MQKVLILTQPLGLNYGGIMQAYALQSNLQNNFYKVKILDWNVYPNNFKWLLSVLKRYILNKFFYRGLSSFPNPFSPRIYHNIITINTRKFISRNINLTSFNLKGNDDFSHKTELYDYNVYIAGSDQVWACSKPSNYVKKCFFDFLKNVDNIKRISYAASFGKDLFCNDLNFINECKELLNNFNAVSVREDSGVKLCKDLFDVNAVHVIDPTMLFDAEHYINLSKERTDYFNDGDCFTYILDKSAEKQRIIDRVSKKFNLKPFNVMPKSSFAEVGPKYIEDCIMPSVEQWLDGFNKAKFIITDSFHGCVFSIIFKKPFLAIGNTERGMARFESLLRMFHLENRLIQSEKDLTEEFLNSKIDYDAVYEILDKERKKAEKFLIEALS